MLILSPFQRCNLRDGMWSQSLQRRKYGAKNGNDSVTCSRTESAPRQQFALCSSRRGATPGSPRWLRASLSSTHGLPILFYDSGQIFNFYELLAQIHIRRSSIKTPITANQFTQRIINQGFSDSDSSSDKWQMERAVLQP